MKSVALFTAMAVVALFATSCIEIHTNDNAGAAIRTQVDAVYYKADVETGDTQVTGTASKNFVFGFISWGDSNFADRTALSCCKANPVPFFGTCTETVKQAAVYNACNKAQCDALAAAKYTLNIEDYVVYKRITCTVKGYPVTQKGIKRIDAPAAK